MLDASGGMLFVRVMWTLYTSGGIAECWVYSWVDMEGTALSILSTLPPTRLVDTFFMWLHVLALGLLSR